MEVLLTLPTEGPDNDITRISVTPQEDGTVKLRVYTAPDDYVECSGTFGKRGWLDFCRTGIRILE